MTHIESKRKVNRRVGKNVGTLESAKHGSGQRLIFTVTKGPKAGNSFAAGLRDMRRRFPTLNPSKVSRFLLES